MNEPRALASIEAEQAILGALLINPKAYDRIGALKADHFFTAIHRVIFEQIDRLAAQTVHADVITIHERMKAETPDLADLPYLDSLNAAFTSANVEHHVEIVIEKSRRRELVALGHRLIEHGTNDADIPAEELIDLAQSDLQKLTETRVTDEPVLAIDDMQDFIADLDRRHRGEGEQGISTDFDDLDDILGGGFRPGLVVVAGRPKMGKSAFAFNIARNIAREKHVLILSMEMGRQEIHSRNVAALGKIDLGRIIDAKRLQQNDWPALTAAVQEIEALNLRVHMQGGMRLSQVRAAARSTQRKHGLNVLIIDYLQLMEGEGDSRNAQIEQITRGLKALAMDMGITIILLSQLNRALESRTNKRPVPSDLRDSGAIEQDCDVAIFLYRDEVYNDNSADRGICEINVALNRQGRPDRVALAFIAHQSRFENLAQGQIFGVPQKPIYSGLKD